MSSMDDKLVEILGDFCQEASGDDDSGFGFRGRASSPSPSPSPSRALTQPQAFQQMMFRENPYSRQSYQEPPRRHHHKKHHHHHHGGGQTPPGFRGPGTPGVPGAPATPAPAGQPFTGAVPIPPGNWGGGTYPPPGWSPGQPLPGYPQGWPPPGSPWPGNFTPGVSNVPQPTGVLTSYDPYGNPVFTQPGQGITYDPYGNPIYPPGMPQPTIDVTVGEAMRDGVKMTEIVGCLRGAGYTSREISGIIGRCCGW